MTLPKSRSRFESGCGLVIVEKDPVDLTSTEKLLLIDLLLRDGKRHDPVGDKLGNLDLAFKLSGQKPNRHYGLHEGVE